MSDFDSKLPPIEHPKIIHLPDGMSTPEHRHEMTNPSTTPAPTKPLTEGCQQEPCYPSLADFLATRILSAGDEPSSPCNRIQHMGGSFVKGTERGQGGFNKDGLRRHIERLLKEYEENHLPDGMPDPPNGQQGQSTAIEPSPQVLPLPLSANGDLNWERVASHETVTMSVDTDKQWLEMTCEVGGFTRRYAGKFTGRISVQPPKS